MERKLQESLIDLSENTTSETQELKRTHDDIFDLSRIPMEVLDKSYVSYEPYNKRNYVYSRTP